MARPEQKSGVLGLAGDLNKKDNPYIPGNDLYELNGWYFGESLSLTKRLGFSKFNVIELLEGGLPASFTGLWEYTPSTALVATDRQQIAAGMTDIYRYGSPNANEWNIISDRAALKRTGTALQLHDSATLLDQMYIGNGKDANLRWDGTRVPPKLFRMGETPPSSVECHVGTTGAFSATASTTGGSINAGTYMYTVTYENDRGMESNPAQDTSGTLITVTATATATTGANSIALSGLPVSAQVQVTKRNIYRTAANGGIYLYLTTIANNTATTYTDTTNDSGLGIAMEQFANGVPPIFSMIDIFKGIAFMGGDPANLSRVWFSGNGLPCSVDPNDYRDLDPNDGDILTGIKRYQGTIVAFKNNSIWNAVGEDRTNISFNKIVSSIGAVNNACIVDVPVKNVLCAISGAGRFFFYNGVDIQYAAFGLEPILNNLNYSQLQRIVGCAVPTLNQIRWTVPYGASDQNNMIIWYDYIQDKWGTTLIPNTLAGYCTMMRDTDNRPSFYVAGVYKSVAPVAGGGYVWKGDSGGSDDGSNIDCEVMDRGHPKNDPNPTNNKMFYHCFVWFKPSTTPGATASVYAHKNDPDSTPLLIGTIDLTKASGQDHIHFNMTGRRCYIHIVENSISSGIVLRGWQVWYKDVGQHHAP